LTQGSERLDFGLTEEQSELRRAVRQFAREVYEPKAADWDARAEHLPEEERRRLAKLDLLAITLPPRYGGSGRPLLDALIVIEELAKASQLAAFPVFEASTGPVRVIELFGTEEQKSSYLPPVARGETTIAVAISEPDAGSAATDLSIQADVHGGEVTLRGTKRWCSGAGRSEQYLVYARFGQERGSKEIGAVLVDIGTPGLTFGPQEKLMGFRGIPSADMFFDNVRVPADRVIVPKGGFRDLFTAFSIERLGNATMSLAIGQACLDRTAAYVQERKQFGKPVVDFQLVHASLATMVMQVDAARLLIYRAAMNAGHGAPNPLEASVAKCFANEMAKQVADMAMQLHGGYGYSQEYGIERMLRDAHGWAIAGGTTNIQRVRVAAEFLERRFDQR
jgi:alkylation response protein AidB-like acyl-CoA dehydrogenase